MAVEIYFVIVWTHEKQSFMDEMQIRLVKERVKWGKLL